MRAKQNCQGTHTNGERKNERKGDRTQDMTPARRKGAHTHITSNKTMADKDKHDEAQIAPNS